MSTRIARPFAALLTVVALTVLPVLPASAATVTGTACGVNEGVTVVVDFAPTTDSVSLGCAAGSQASIGAALTAAGFDFDTESTAFGNYLCAIESVAANPGDCQAFPGAFWSPWLNTTDGAVSSPFTSSWTSAMVGVDGGPLAVGTVVGFRQNVDGSWPGPTPGLALTELPTPDNTALPVPAYGPGAADAAAVAGWLGRQMDSGLLADSPGLTVDAVYALASAGVGGTVIDHAASTLAASGTTYVGSPAEAVAKYARSAKLSLALQIAGLDPTAFADVAGTRDLLGEVRSVLNADGSFGSYDDPFLHSFAVIALSRTTGGVPGTALTWLEAQQCSAGPATGAFGYPGCETADVDYTAMAIQGLLAAGASADDPAVQSAQQWLEHQQVGGGFAGNTNSTGLAGQTLAALGAPATAARAYIGGLQLTCALISGTALTADAVGAIAWKPASLADAQQFGLDSGNLGEWQYASVQAALALGAGPLAALSAEGADPELPAATDCTPPPLTPTPSSDSTEPTSTVLDTSAATSPVLSATGPGAEVRGQLWAASGLVIVGVGLLVLARSRRAGRHR